MPKFLFEIYKRLSEKEELNEDEKGLNDDEDGMYPQPRRRRRHTDEFNDITDEMIEKSDRIMTFLNNRE